MGELLNTRSASLEGEERKGSAERACKSRAVNEREEKIAALEWARYSHSRKKERGGKRALPILAIAVPNRIVASEDSPDNGLP